jgi:hypothetical protein
MINLKYGEIPNDLFKNYLKCLIGKIYKILPMYEQNDTNLKKYLESFQIEIIGNIDLINKLKYDGNFLVLLGTLEYFVNNEIDKNNGKEIYKREIFKCIDIIKKIKIKNFDNGGERF